MMVRPASFARLNRQRIDLDLDHDQARLDTNLLGNLGDDRHSFDILYL